MVDPADVPTILLDAARLIREGELVVFGSASLAFWLTDAPSTRDVDVWVVPVERGEMVEALMGELSWYHDRHDAYVEVWGPETFAAPTDWRARAKVLEDASIPGVTLVVPHPHDVLLAKLERWDDPDRAHARQILAELPCREADLDRLVAKAPYRTGQITDDERIVRFDAHLEELRAMLGPDPGGG